MVHTVMISAHAIKRIRALGRSSSGYILFPQDFEPMPFRHWISKANPIMQRRRLLKFRLAGSMILAAASLPMTSALAAEPVLPTSENGFYMIQGNPDELSEYMPVDALCISETLDNFAAVKNAGHGTADFMLLNRDGKLSRDNFRIMGPDAGASQIRYTLNDPASGDVVVELHYINPGALGDPSTLPMTALSSISIPIFGSKQGRCLLATDIVYAGVDRNRKMLVIMEEDGSITLHESSEKNESIAKTVADGFWSTGKTDDIIFSFIEGHKLTTIKAAPHEHIEYPAWRVADRDGQQFSSSPQGFFVADIAKLGPKAIRLPYGLAVHFERLEICRHLAGETSGNTQRDNQVTESWNNARCDEAKSRHAEYEAQYSGNGRISTLLKAHAMDF